MIHLTVFLKILLMLVSLAVIAAPLAAEYLSFRADKRAKISYKRFRIVVYSLLYAIAVTVSLTVFRNVFVGIEQNPIVRMLASRVAGAPKIAYTAKVILVLALNFAIGLLFKAFIPVVRIGLKKLDFTVPLDGEKYNFAQKIERRVVGYFSDEVWTIVALALKYLCGLLSGCYAVLFLLFMIPALFEAPFFPYVIASTVLSASYVYPVITLLILWECYFFLSGVRVLETECPDILKSIQQPAMPEPVELAKIDEELRRQFSNYYVCDADFSNVILPKDTAAEHNQNTDLIAAAVESDARCPHVCRELYLNCLDKLFESHESVLINGHFFTEFSLYFFRYLSILVARGDNLVIVCNTDTEIETVSEYLRQGLSQITSLYCKDFQSESVDYDDPIWRIIAVKGDGRSVEETAVAENSILVTSLLYLNTTRFEEQHKRFIHLIDTIIFIDTIETINRYERQLRSLHTRLRHITELNAQKSMNGSGKNPFRVRYMSRPIRYICFDDSRTPGLDKVLKNMFSMQFDSADVMHFSEAAMVRCYNYEGQKNSEGRISSPQFIDSHEEIGVLMNMAILCLANGAPRVCIFADDDMAFENISESIQANIGRLPFKINRDAISINRYLYDPNDYSVILAMDHKNNLPRTLRRFVSMPSEKQTLVIVFSKPYLLRDFYSTNINQFWSRMQLAGIPIAEGSQKDIIEKILVQANAGGISERALLQLAEEFQPFSQMALEGNVNGILLAILNQLGIYDDEEESGKELFLFRYFEFILTHEFLKTGEYCAEKRILLRRSGKLFDAINGGNLITLKNGSVETVLSLPRTRLTQNYIAGQNLIYNGNIYHIQSIDAGAGMLHTVLAYAGHNDEAHQYRQVREYHIEGNIDTVGIQLESRHIALKRSEEDISISDVFIMVSRTPVEVLTKGYYELSPHSMAFDARQAGYHCISDEVNDALALAAYRRYGNVCAPAYPDAAQTSNNGALTLTLRIVGSFGEKKEGVTALAAAMLNELMQSMFPSVADSIVIFPVMDDSQADDESREVMSWVPKYVGSDASVHDKSMIELVLMEDCPDDLGVISALMSAGSDVLFTLFSPIYHYLKWYQQTDEKSRYLWYGLDHEPSCFNFKSLLVLAKLLGDNKHDLRFIDIESTVACEQCDFCGKAYPKHSNALNTFEDGRRICAACAKQLTGSRFRLLQPHVELARRFIESTYGVQLDRDIKFCFKTTEKLIKRMKRAGIVKETDSETALLSFAANKKVYLEGSIPPANIAELTARELVRTWQAKHLHTISEELREGHIALVSIQYLRFLRHNTIAQARQDKLEKSQFKDGFGYRELIQHMQEKPTCKNNPFLYLIELEHGDGTDATIVNMKFPESGDLYFGRLYTPQKPDRVFDGNIRYYHYGAMTATLKKQYEVMLSAIQNYEESVPSGGLSLDELRRISLAILYDHPELFYYRTFATQGDTVLLLYGATKEEADVIQRQIDEAVPRFLEGVDDSMSAYDVALRVHTRIIQAVDYDTIALEREEIQPDRRDIDRLRTICGALLDRAAVCEGYARAVQYLLQKCGIECAECSGDTIKGGPHAWNIVKIDGEYYYLDTTWDDSSNTAQEVRDTDLGFNYFCVTTEELRKTRGFDTIPTAIPVLTAKRANYFEHNDLVLDQFDLTRIKTFAERSGAAKQNQMTFKCRTLAVYLETISQLFGLNGKGADVVRAAAKKNRDIDADKYRYRPYEKMLTITILFQKRESLLEKVIRRTM